MRIFKLIDEHFEEVVLVANLIVMSIVTMLQVIMRSVFNNSLFWSEELCRYLFLYQVWLGASFAAKKVRHLKVDILPNKLGPKAGKKILVIGAFVSIIFCLFLAYTSFEQTLFVASQGQKSAALQIPMWIPYFSVPLGAALMSLRFLQYIVILLRSEKQENVDVAA